MKLAEQNACKQGKDSSNLLLSTESELHSIDMSAALSSPSLSSAESCLCFHQQTVAFIKGKKKC